MPRPPGAGADTEYDLVHARARSWPGGCERSGALLDLEFEFQGESLSLDAARARRRALDRHGITVHIVPVRYREPGMSTAEARAQALLSTGTGGHRDAAAPRLESVHPMYYVFAPAPDADGQGPAAGPSPSRRVTVDRCDGHLWTEQERDAYFSAIGPR